MPEPPPRLSDALAAACRKQGGVPAWLAALRRRTADVAAATGGHPIVVAIHPTDRRPLVVAFASDGHVAAPFDPDADPDVTIQGDADQVAAFLLGDQPLDRAIASGLVVLRQPEVPHDRLVRLRRVAAQRLQELLSGLAAVAVVARRTGLRLWAFATQYADAVPAVIERASVAVIIAASAAAPAAGASALSSAPPDVAYPLVPAATPMSATSPGPSPQLTTATQRHAAPAAPVTTTIPPAPTGRVVVSRRTDAAGDDTWNESVITVHCTTSFQRSVCAALDHLPSG